MLGDKSLVSWFLAHGADPNKESSYGLSPMMRAVREASLEIVQILHAAGGSVTNTVPFVCSPFKYTDEYVEGRLEVLRFLIDAGANLNAREYEHNSRGRESVIQWGCGLNIALALGGHDLAEELLRRGARTDVPTMNLASQGETALELARQYAPDLVPIVEETRRRQV